jgi:ATP-dependent Zn protease
VSDELDDPKLTAIHEAGHVVLQELFFPGEQYEVDIVGLEGLANGKTTPPLHGWRPRVTQEDKEHELLKAVGGIVAESIETGVEWHNVTGAEKDLEAACVAFAMLKFQRGKGGNADRIRSCLADRQTQLASYYNSAKSVLLRNWGQVKKVAESLLSKNRLTGDEVRAILGSSDAGSTVQG